MFESRELLAKVAQAHALLAEVAAAVASDMAGVLASQLLAEAFGAVRQGELATCRLIERVDRSGQFAVDGAASAAAYVRVAAQERAAWASKRVTLGRELADRLPATAKVWEAGLLGLDHADVIAGAIRNVDDPRLAGEIERILSEAAADGLGPTDLAQLADRVRAQTVPEEAAAKATRQHRDQQLHASKTLGGMVNVTGWLDPEAGAFFSQALAFFTPKGPSAEQVHGDPSCFEPVGFRRSLGLLQMARHAMAHAEGCNGDGATRETLIVGIGLDALTTGRGIATLAGGGAMTAAAARRMACDTNLIPAVLGADSEILDFGRRTRLISPGLRAAITLRDGGCVFAGCDRPPSWCEGHHRHTWLYGGPTSPENLDLLCSRHHHLVHEGGWRITIGADPGRTPHFHPPNGRRPLKGQRRPLITRPTRT